MRLVRLALALAAGLGLAALVVDVGRPGLLDMPSPSATGMEPVDDGYWSAPLRRLSGAGRQDAFDERLALSLALPQNAVGAAAVALGAPYPAARFAGVVLAALLVGFLAVRGGSGGAFLLPFLATPPVFGHLTSDLGEGPATAIAVAWSLAALRRRWALAGLLAGIGLFQKACGLYLGVGLLAGVLFEGPDRAARAARAALGVAVGVALAAGVAAWVFGDDPVAFARRPWTATEATGSVPGLGRLISMAFPAHHGVGAAFALPLLVAALLARRMGPRPPALVAAAIAGLLFAGAFPDAWRIVPVLPLVAFALHRDRGVVLPPEAPAGPWAFLLSLAVVPQAVGSLAAYAGWRPGALALAGLSLAGVALLSTRPARRSRAVPVAAALVWLLALVAGTAAVAQAFSGRGERRADLATYVSRRLGPSAHLIAYSCVGAEFSGTLWYPPFARLWEPELRAAAPGKLYRLRAAASGEVPAPPPPAGWSLSSTESLGLWPYSGKEPEVPLFLDTMRR